MKLLKYALCFSLLCLTACSPKDQTQPEATVTKFLDAYQKQDTKTMQAYSTWDEYDFNALELRDEDYIAGVDQALQKSVYEKMLAFSHSEEVKSKDDTNAVVTVTLQIYDFETAIEEGLKEVEEKAKELGTQSTNKDAQAQLLSTLFTRLDQSKQDQNVMVNVHVILEQGTWRVDDANDELKAALVRNTQVITNTAQ